MDTLHIMEVYDMKTLGIVLIGLLAVAGGIAAATIITKKKLEKQNEEDYFDDWEDIDWDDEDDVLDSNFDAPEGLSAEDVEAVSKEIVDLIEDEPAAEDGGEL